MSRAVEKTKLPSSRLKSQNKDQCVMLTWKPCSRQAAKYRLNLDSGNGKDPGSTLPSFTLGKLLHLSVTGFFICQVKMLRSAHALEHVLGARHCSRHLACITSFNHLNSPMRVVRVVNVIIITSISK